MSNYSYAEIQNMQKKAMERVREMQRRSSEVLEEAPKSVGQGRITDAPKPRVTNMPPNFPDFKTFFEDYSPTNANTPAQREVSKSTQQNSQGNILENVFKEPDKALLLGLWLLLKSEGADEALQMALMYIMS